MTKFEGHNGITDLEFCVMSEFVTLMSVAAHNRSSVSSSGTCGRTGLTLRHCISSVNSELVRIIV